MTRRPAAAFAPLCICYTPLVSTHHDIPRWIEQNLPNEVRDRCYFFNSFFYKKLTEKQKVKRGGKMVDEEEDEHLWQQVPPDV